MFGLYFSACSFTQYSAVAGLRRASTNRVGAELRFVQRRVGLLRFRTAWVAGEGAGTAGKGAGTASSGRQDDDDDDDLLLKN